jgi:hypothetical protein
VSWPKMEIWAPLAAAAVAVAVCAVIRARWDGRLGPTHATPLPPTHATPLQPTHATPLQPTHATPLPPTRPYAEFKGLSGPGVGAGSEGGLYNQAMLPLPPD